MYNWNLLEILNQSIDLFTIQSLVTLQDTIMLSQK